MTVDDFFVASIIESSLKDLSCADLFVGSAISPSSDDEEP